LAPGILPLKRLLASFRGSHACHNYAFCFTLSFEKFAHRFSYAICFVLSSATYVNVFQLLLCWPCAVCFFLPEHINLSLALRDFYTLLFSRIEDMITTFTQFLPYQQQFYTVDMPSLEACLLKIPNLTPVLRLPISHVVQYSSSPCCRRAPRIDTLCRFMHPPLYAPATFSHAYYSIYKMAIQSQPV
jgi:hypothetical protein